MLKVPALGNEQNFLFVETLGLLAVSVAYGGVHSYDQEICVKNAFDAAQGHSGNMNSPFLPAKPIVPSPRYNYVRARQLEGSYNDDPSIGCWAISSLRVARGWGTPSEQLWPYDEQPWPPPEPPDVDAAAKANRTVVYQRVRSIHDCKCALAQRRLVVASFEIVSQDWSKVESGFVPMPAAWSKSDVSHCVTLVGYDDSRTLLKFRNSWGADWGDRGDGYLSYAYFEKYQLDAWIIPYGDRLGSREGRSGILEERWGVPDLVTGAALHGFEFFDATNDECVGWAFVVERDGLADIEELFVRPTYRGHGYGRRLADLIRMSPRIAGLPLRLWVSHADRQSVSDPAVIGTLARLGLSVRTSDQRWAAFVAVGGNSIEDPSLAGRNQGGDHEC